MKTLEIIGWGEKKINRTLMGAGSLLQQKIDSMRKDESGAVSVELVLLIVENYLSFILYRFCRKNISMSLYHIHPINPYVSINKKGVIYVLS